MKNTKLFLILCISLWLGVSPMSYGQSKLADYTEDQLESYKRRAEDQVRFLEYLLNTLGNSQTNQRDKEVIIKESYLKVFRDAEVQVEDDLTEGRKVITNKDITAYLKDVDFFFKHAHFDFELQAIEALEKTSGGLYFKVTINRTLKATGLEGESVLNSQKRFVEINLNEVADELQIASIYTTKVSKEKALREWWQQLSFAWREIFQAAILLYTDSITSQDLYKIAGLDSLNLTGNNFIQNVDPLSMLSDLTYLNLENSSVKSIDALSSLTNLKTLNLSNTVISDLNYIQYAENIEVLILNNTLITDLKPIQHFSQLQDLSIQSTPIQSFEIISELKQLKYLNLSDTKFSDASASIIYGLDKLVALNLSRTAITTLYAMVPPQLKQLDVTFTAVSQLQPLSGHMHLKVVSISNSQVRSITPLLNLPVLQRVYADNLFINADALTTFKNERPKVLLIVDSEELTAWWASLDFKWKKQLTAYLPSAEVNDPSKEALSQLITLDSLILSNAGITQLFPIKKFKRLIYLDLSYNEISSIGPLAEINSIVSLNLGNNKISNINALSALRKLQYLNLSANSVPSQDLFVLERLVALQQLNLNQLGLQKEEVSSLVNALDHKCLIRYDDKTVISWWTDLSSAWQQIFLIQQSMEVAPDIWQLSALLQREQIAIAEESLPDLLPLKQFLGLTALYMEQLDVQDYEALAALSQLKVLHIKRMPFADLNVLRSNSSLEQLNLDLTAVEDLRPLEQLPKLKLLSVIGTPLSSVNGVEVLKKLEYLNIASTNVRSVKGLEGLILLNKLICYNTRIKERHIEKYQSINPACEITWY